MAPFLPPLHSATRAQSLLQRLRWPASWPGLAFGLVGIDLLALYGYLGQRLYLLNPIWVYLLVYALCFGLYVYAAGRLLPLLPRARPLTLFIVALGVLFRLCVLHAAPSLTTDMFRYVWDGRLTLHGINPFHWAPNAPALRPLRDATWEHMEYRPYNTIYMPVSQAVFALGYWLFGNNLTGYKAIYTLCDVGVMGLLLVMLRLLRRPPSQIIWYAWCPLPITEIALAGHQDVVGLLFLMLTFVLAAQPRTALWAAPTLVAAILTKGFALVLVPLFCRTYGWRFALCAALSLALMGLPLWLYLPDFLHGMKQYLANVHVNSGLFSEDNRLLARMTKQHYADATHVSDALIVLVTLWAARRPARSYADLLGRSFVALAVTLLVVPTLFPWYLIWVLPFVALLGSKPSWAFVLLSGTAVLLYTFYVSMTTYWWTPLAEYVPFYLLLAWEYRAWLLRRRAARERHAAQRDWRLA